MVVIQGQSRLHSKRPYLKKFSFGTAGIITIRNKQKTKKKPHKHKNKLSPALMEVCGIY